MRRTTAIATLATVVLIVAGCSNSSGNDPKPTATVTTTKTQLSAAEQRTVCVDAWATLLQDNADASVDEAPSDCDGVPEGDKLDAYMEGLQEHNEANRDAAKDCIDDPTCTALPVP